MRKKVVEVQKLRMSVDISYAETVKLVQREHKERGRSEKIDIMIQYSE